MRPTRKALAALALGLALTTATTAAGATLPTGTQDQTDQRKALYQSELERNLQQRTQAGNGAVAEHGLAAQRKAVYQLDRSLARHHAFGAVGASAAQAVYQLDRSLARHHAQGATAAQPAARTDPAAPSPGVNVAATLLVGLVGGLLGGAVAVVGWTATIHRRRPRTAAAPEPASPDTPRAA